jgi:anti-sigma B factor antagonist
VKIETERRGEVEVVQLAGRLDASQAPAVASVIERLSSARPAMLVANLGDVSFLDSMGLSVLVRGMKRCREHGGDLRVCCLKPPVRMIFELTRLDKAFEIHSGEEEAVASFS